MRDVVSTAVTVVTLAAWIADRLRVERVLAYEREQHRRELEAADMRRQVDVAAALTDPTTGLPTRRAWEPAASARLCSPAELALLDIDEFKQINDTHGHLVGDHVLRLVSSRIRRALGGDALLGRAGGDEIVVVTAPGVDWDRVLTLVTAPTGLSTGCVIHIGVSLGVVGARELAGSPDLSQALNLADQAMYEAKKVGGGWQRAALSDRCRPLLPQTA